MSFEILIRIHKELTITGHTFYETVLAISEQVNRKVHILRLHWQASLLLQRIDEATSTVGQHLARQVSIIRRDQCDRESALETLRDILAGALTRIQDLKRTLTRVDAHIREIKLETIREDLVSLQRDLTLRSAGIERLLVSRNAAATSQPLRALPPLPSSRVVAILRGPCLLTLHEDLTFRAGDIVVVIGPQTELDQLIPWFTGQRPLTAILPQSA